MKNEDLTYSEAIEQVMLENGYYAPLKLIYKEIWKYKDQSKLKGKTPNLTIQERVQRDKRFTKIGLGIYALSKYVDILPKPSEPKNEKERKVRVHSEIQGMLLEIGNSKRDVEDTYTSDKNCLFGNKRLKNIATLKTIPEFTYKKIIQESVNYLDVVWFNHRGFPSSIFEVEHSTDFRDAFIKFMEMQDFMTNFYCVSPESKLDKFIREKSKMAFKPIEDRVKFLTYEQVINDYNRAIQEVFII